MPPAVRLAVALGALALGAGCGEPGASVTPTGSAAASSRPDRTTDPEPPRAGAGSTPGSTAGSAPGSTLAPPPDGVAIADFRFRPPDLAVPAGTTVTFRNDDDFEHQVQRLDTGERSPVLGAGDTWSTVITGPDPVPYYCAIHNVMRASVRVS